MKIIIKHVVILAILLCVGAPSFAVPQPTKSADPFAAESFHWTQSITPALKAKEAAKEAAANELPKPTQTYVIDDFKDRSLKAWWGFGDLLFDVVDNSVGQFEPTTEGRSIRFQGKTKEWGVGGCGRFLGLNSSQFNCLKMMLKGNAKAGTSATMIVELYVSQDNQWMSQDEKRREYTLRYECKFTHQMNINWKGWRVVTIPFKAFLTGSPRIKKHFWDASKQEAMGTIVQIQFVVLAPEKKGSVDFQLGSLAFAKDPNIGTPDGVLDF